MTMLILRKIILVCFSLSFFVNPAGAGVSDAFLSRYYAENGYIKWVDFNVPYPVLEKAYNYDIGSFGKDVRLSMTELLSLVSYKNGNEFNGERDNKTMAKFAERIRGGETADAIAGGNKYYKYFHEVYSAVFANFLGERADGKYGLTAYHPIAKGYWFNHFDDFGTSRTYGYRRRHLGHDFTGGVGTPLVAVENGVITELGWNRYGGWRIGIRSEDTKRYYYYAHLRKDKPFAEGLEKGQMVKAGQHIGYLGVTGYSTKENVNMQAKPHLHFGLQLIFDPSQESGNKEIWIDVYAISKLLAKNQKVIPKN